MTYDLKGLTCKVCNKKYHNCSSCGYVDEEVAFNNDCCSFECLRASKEFTNATKNAQAFYNSLNEEQKKQFQKFNEDQYNYKDMDLYKTDEERAKESRTTTKKD